VCKVRDQRSEVNQSEKWITLTPLSNRDAGIVTFKLRTGEVLDDED